MLGNYELLGRIAMGGMAEIFRARQHSDAGFEKDVVIKRILPQYTDDLDFIRMFQDEAVLAARLSHPNVVQVFDFKNVDGGYFIAMEYVEGFDLRRLMSFGNAAGKPLGANRAVQVAIGMARGLGHAHERTSGGIPLKIVHRDVSPHNVLISLGGDVKVMDFGIAKAAARAAKTSTGILKGKLSYMSPEQGMAVQDIDHRVDIYATGIVLWEMLANRRLFDGANEIELLMQVQKGEVPPIRQFAPDIPLELERCVNKFLERDRDQRYQRMRDAEKDLAQVLTKMGGAEAEPLEEYVRDVVPQDQIDALRGSGEEHAAGGTQSISTAPSFGTADTQMLERTKSEVRPDVRKTSVATTLTPSGQMRPAPEKPRRTGLYVGAATGALVVTLGAWALMRALTPAPVQPSVSISLNEPDAPPKPVEIAAPPKPVEPPPQQPPPVAKPEPTPAPPPPQAKKPNERTERDKEREREKEREKEKKGKSPAFRTPGRAAPGTPRIEIAGCPIGAVVYDGETPLGLITAANQDSFPVSAGPRTISVRNTQGDMIGKPARISPQQDELENYACR